MGLSVRNNEGCCEYILNCPLSDWTDEFNPSSNLKLGPMYFIMYTFTSSGHPTVSSHSITFSLYKEHNIFSNASSVLRNSHKYVQIFFFLQIDRCGGSLIHDDLRDVQDKKTALHQALLNRLFL